MDDEPDLPAELVWVWNAFQALTSSRQVTMGGVGPIPFEAIDRYAARYGIDGDAFDEFLRLIAHMDAIYMAHANSRSGGSPPDQPRHLTLEESLGEDG